MLIHLMKDQAGQVICFEKLNFAVQSPDQLWVSFEAVSI